MASAPSSGDGALLDDGQRRGGTGTQQDGRSLARRPGIAAAALSAMMGSRITGALITLLSSTMAKGWPTCLVLTSAKRRVPMESRAKFTARRRRAGPCRRWRG